MNKAVSGALASLLLSPTLVFAQGWDWKLTPYLWAAGLDGAATVGPIRADFTMGFSEIVNVLDGGALLRLEGQSEQHGVFGDLVYLKLEDENARDTAGGTLEARLDSLILEGAYIYRWTEKYGLELGFRYYDFEAALKPAAVPEVSKSSEWTDGFLGFRADSQINPDWSWLFRASIGAGGSDLAAGLQVDFRRKYSNVNELTLGVRALDVEYGSSSGSVPGSLDLSMAGLTVGYSFAL
jgi:hypothetical protein